MEDMVSEGQLETESETTAKPGVEYFDPQFPCQFLSYLNECRKTKTMTDFTVIITEKTFHTHRVVLASLSSYFDSMLKFGGKDESEVHFDWLEPDIFSDILDYAYTGSIHFSPDTVQNIIMAANYFNITNIKEEGQRMMVSNLDINNIFYALHFAVNYSLDILRQGFVEYFMKHMVDIIETTEYLRLESKVLVEIFNSDNLVVEHRDGSLMNSVDREKLVFRAVLRYLSDKLPKRLKGFEDLMATVRLPYLSKNDVNAVFEDFPTLKRNGFVKKYIILSNKITRLRKKNEPVSGLPGVPQSWRNKRKLVACEVIMTPLGSQGVPEDFPFDPELQIKSITVWKVPPEEPISICGLVVRYHKASSERQYETQYVTGVLPNACQQVEVELAPDEHIIYVEEYRTHLGTVSLVFGTDKGVSHCPLGLRGTRYKTTAGRGNSSYLYSIHCDLQHMFGQPSISNTTMRWIGPEEF